ncbi:hypothetical protein [Desulfosporosinus fructosivorans]|uniref:hypothetical protein n=1 Tax=Desulfosporosinus fructosivorans TaxID=2018669 RepID=UPI001A7EE9EF|nr:hypothetical protein [Desulfosporosinus fructosivorans]
MATTHAKGVGACEHGPSGLRSTEEERGTACFQRCWKSGRRRNAWHGDVFVAWGRFVCHVGRLSKVRVTPPRTLRSSCQTRALILLARDRIPGKSAILGRCRRETSLFPALPMKVD